MATFRTFRCQDSEAVDKGWRATHLYGRETLFLTFFSGSNEHVL